ncbi:MAG TPA: sugar phosphate nucleotidyltransferase, partial [Acidobacteriota bacterium]|nr:sugar phosphate nucleotidyltransferase [Acidobacteriota bacterium]
ARQHWLITFGIKPDYAATGYGYVERAGSIGQAQDLEAFQVARFIEKPDRDTAREFIANPSFSWNSGMFVWTIAGILSEIDEHMPVLGAALKEIESSTGDSERARSIFEGVPKTSIDYGVMERTERAAVIPCQFGWSDVGSWKALRDLNESDASGIIGEGLHEAILSRDCIISARPSKLVALVGVKDLVIVDTEEVLLVCSGEHTEDVKKVVESLKEKGLNRYL